MWLCLFIIQEAQFEKLTRELEAERQSVAHQLEKVSITVSNITIAVVVAILYTIWRYS